MYPQSMFFSKNKINIYIYIYIYILVWKISCSTAEKKSLYIAWACYRIAGKVNRISKTCPCNVYFPEPHFYGAKPIIFA